MESPPQIRNSGIILKTFTHEYVKGRDGFILLAQAYLSDYQGKYSIDGPELII